MNYTDEQLKRALAKMLPENVEMVKGYCSYNREFEYLAHKQRNCYGQVIQVLDTELLHLCWLIKESFNKYQLDWFDKKISLMNKRNPDWRDETIALAKVNGIEI